jgi:uncharacterized protein (DUF934 family)
MRLVREERDGSGERRYALADDSFVHLPDEAEIPPHGDVIVSWSRWKRERAALARHAGRLGVRLPSDTKVDEVAPDLERFAVVAVEFPSFTDGRGYSIARLLRERYGYRGELRAVGDVLRDQLFFMARCGFDAFEIAPRKSAEDALAALTEITVRYQPAADEKLPLWKRQARRWPVRG